MNVHCDQCASYLFFFLLIFTIIYLLELAVESRQSSKCCCMLAQTATMAASKADHRAESFALGKIVLRTSSLSAVIDVLQPFEASTSRGCIRLAIIFTCFASCSAVRRCWHLLEQSDLLGVGRWFIVMLRKFNRQTWLIISQELHISLAIRRV